VKSAGNGVARAGTGLNSRPARAKVGAHSRPRMGRLTLRRIGIGMKVTLERAALLKSLGHVHRVVERRNTIPILSNVLLKAEGPR
jgi:hypothetical protein